MDRKQREKYTMDATKRLLDLAKMPEPETRIYRYLFDSFGLDMLRAGASDLEQNIREKLTESGVVVTVAHYTGDSSYPTEYTVKYGDLQATGPTFDLALTAFLLRLLPTIHRPRDNSRVDIEVENAEAHARQDWSNDE